VQPATRFVFSAVVKIKHFIPKKRATHLDMNAFPTPPSQIIWVIFRVVFDPSFR
jgi:hypothetical protein